MNIVSQIKKHGCINTAFDAFLRLFEKTVGGYVCYCITLPFDILPSQFNSFDSCQYSYGFLELEQLLKLIKPEEMTMTHSFAEQAYAKGDKCFGVIDGGNLVHYNWTAISDTNVVGNLIIKFPTNMVYVYNSYTNPQYRGKCLQPTARTLVLKSYIDKGYCGAIGVLSMNNFSSLSAAQKIGFSIAGFFIIVSTGKSYSFTSKRCINNGIKLVRV